MKNIYLCASFHRQAELRQYRETLTQLGYHITSRWLDEAGDDPTESQSQRRALATRDLEDLMEADTLLAFTETPHSPYSRGGRHVEWGIALMLSSLGASGIRLLVIGPEEHIFHSLADARYETFFDACEHFLAGDWRD